MGAPRPYYCETAGKFYEKKICRGTTFMFGSIGRLVGVAEIPDDDDRAEANGNQQDPQGKSDLKENALEAIHLPD